MSEDGWEAPSSSTGVNDEFDLENLFSNHPEYNLISESLATLERQLKQAENDIRTLQDLKTQCSTEQGLRQLMEAVLQPSDSTRPLTFPRLQRVKLIPNLDLVHYQEQLPRRVTSKHDQNLEFFINKLQEEQARRPHQQGDTLEVLSNLLPLPRPELIITRTTNDPRETIRKKFAQVVAPLRSASAPSISNGLHGGMNGDVTLATTTTTTTAGPTALYAPQPVKAAAAAHFTIPLVPSSREVSPLHHHHQLRSRSTSHLPMTNSTTPHHPFSPFSSLANLGPHPDTFRSGLTTSTTTNTTSAAADGSKKKRRKMVERNLGSTHHNLPWTTEERRRLEELLLVYPEEEIFARRCAKIAAALGTRTSSQVANRLNKLSWKERQRRQANEDQLLLDIGADDDDEVGSGDIGNTNRKNSMANGKRFLNGDDDEDGKEGWDEQVMASSEYRLYVRMKKLVRRLEEDSTLPVHHGFRCDGCGIEPIVGARWRCTKCREPHEVDLCEECYKMDSVRNAPRGKSKHRPTHQFITTSAT